MKMHFNMNINLLWVPSHLAFSHLTSILVDKFISNPFVQTAARYSVMWIGYVLFLIFALLHI